MRMLAWVNLLQTDGLRQPCARVAAPRRRHAQLARRRLADRGDGADLRLHPVLHPAAYAALERLDGRLIEASRDLGASSFWTFLRVTLPLSVPGLLAASRDHRAADVRRLLHQHLSHRRLAAHRDGRQPDRVLPARFEPTPDRRLAGGHPDGVPDGGDGVLPRHDRPLATRGSAAREAPPVRSAGDHHVAVHRVVAGAGADRRAHLVQLRRSRSTFQSPSFRWYWDDPASVWHDDALQTALANTLKLAVADDADRRAARDRDGDRAAALARARRRGPPTT